MMNLAKTFPSTKAQLIAVSSLIFVSLPLALFLPVSIMVSFALLVALRLTLIAIGKKALPVWQILLFAVGLAALVYMNLNLLWGREGGLAVLLLFVTMKSFDGGTYRDWQMLLLFCFFLVIGPLLFEQEVYNAIWMILSLGSILFAFAILSQAPVKSAAKQTFFALLISAPFMAVLFLAIPRLPEPIMQFPQNQNQQSGLLSDTLSPGSVSELILSNRQIFNAVFEDGYYPRNNQLYWRMMVMPDFDGVAWSAAPSEMADGANPKPSSVDIRYSVTLVDQRGRLPALDYPLSGDGESRKGYGNTIAANRSYSQLRRVDLRSNGLASLPESLSDSMQRQYTLLPETNPRTQQWAKQLAAQSQDSEAFIKKILAHLETGGYEYTLRPDKLNHTQDQVDELLFKTKNGFCEHYASAFAVAMRAGGLPARVVVGYQGGSYYTEGGFWQIRGKDAHAWTEVWQPETKAWLRVDPTAAVSVTRIDSGIDDALSQEEQGTLSEAVGNSSGLWNLVKVNSEFYWQQWVVGFNADKQQDLFKKLGLENINAATVLIVLLVGGLLAFIPVFLWWGRFLRRQGNPLSEGFDLLKHKLFGADFAIAALGPMEVLERLAQEQVSLYKRVKPLIDTFIRLNYRSTQPDKKANRQWLRQIKKFKV